MAVETAGDAPPGGGEGSVAGAAFLLGFALSGFSDGILLHQILQWHHLLSALDGDLRFQVVADGWFHLAMYAVAAAGLWRLWRARGALGGPVAGSALRAWGLVGFGSWHVVDALLSHWLLGIHRIRMDAANPLLWDLLWAGAFGLVPLLLGLGVRGGSGGPGGSRSAAALLAAATLGAGVWAAAPPSGRDFATVVFAPHVPPDRAFASAAGAGGGVVWADEAAGVFVVSDLRPRAAVGLLGRGALFVGGAGLPPGCLAWTRAS